jgi:hypothetical protein
MTLIEGLPIHRDECDPPSVSFSNFMKQFHCRRFSARGRLIQQKRAESSAAASDAGSSQRISRESGDLFFV